MGSFKDSAAGLVLAIVCALALAGASGADSGSLDHGSSMRFAARRQVRLKRGSPSSALWGMDGTGGLGATSAVAGRITMRLRGGKGATLSTQQKKLFQDLSKEEGIFSASEPGEWQGKEGSHVPTITRTAEGVEVVVKHGMDPKDLEEVQAIMAGKTTARGDTKGLHYIEFIWIIDEDTGEALAAKNLYAGTETKAVFKGDFADRCITPYALCNLHGTWRGDSIGTPKAKEESVMDDEPPAASEAVEEAAAGGDDGGDEGGEAMEEEATA